jgi:hypothetical protein
MIKKRRGYTHSRTSPKGGKRGCLCADGKTYSSKCCDGSLQAQGIGNITGESLADNWNGYTVTSCSDGHVRHVHIHDATLTVGKVYYLTLENNHNHCYTITSTHHSEGIHINTASVVYDDCSTCQSANP